MSKPLDLEGIKARMNAATAGPWEWTRDYELSRKHWALHNPEQPDGGIGDGHSRVVDFHLVLYTNSKKDMNGVPLDQTPNFQFIAHAREDVPALVAEVERLQKLLAEKESRK